MTRALLVLYWRWRLNLARQYRANCERVLRWEIAKAQHDFDHCQTQLARAQMARVEARADRKARA
jgi:hypothetical protein